MTRTSLDMELDLQASQTRLSHLMDENVRLRELTKKIEEAKARGMLIEQTSNSSEFVNLKVDFRRIKVAVVTEAIDKS